MNETVEIPFIRRLLPLVKHEFMIKLEVNHGKVKKTPHLVVVSRDPTLLLITGRAYLC